MALTGFAPQFTAALDTRLYAPQLEQGSTRFWICPGSRPSPTTNPHLPHT